MKLLNRIAIAAEQRVKKYGAQYYTLGIVGLINFPLAYLYERNSQDTADIIWIRLIAILLCFLLLIKNRAPTYLKKFIPLYWYITIVAVLPMLTTILLIRDGFSLNYLINFNVGAMIVILLLDWLSFLIVEIIGVICGILFVYLAKIPIHYNASQEDMYLFLYMFFCTVILGSIFTRNKEVHNDYLQRAKDLLNDELEQKVLERTSELEKALAAKTEFLNNMSHEVRTPVQGITAISEGLVDHWHKFDDQKRLDLAKQVAKNAQRLFSLVTNLLDLSKFSIGKMSFDFKKSNFTILVEEMIEECQELYINGSNIEFNYATFPPIEAVMDSQRIIQVLRNLFSNSIKFSPKNGIITVQICQSKIVCADDSKVKAVHFIISDEGIGIPPEELEAIFDAFTQSTRTKTRAGGTGLGLSIAREIITAHQGKLWAENNTTAGSSFHFIIPLMQDIY